MGWGSWESGVDFRHRDFSLPQVLERIWGPISADERWVGIRYRLPGPGGTEGGSGHDNVAYFFVTVVPLPADCTQLTLSDEAQVTLQLTVGLSNIK